MFHILLVQAGLVRNDIVKGARIVIPYKIDAVYYVS